MRSGKRARLTSVDEVLGGIASSLAATQDTVYDIATIDEVTEDEARIGAYEKEMHRDKNNTRLMLEKPECHVVCESCEDNNKASPKRA